MKFRAKMQEIASIQQFGKVLNSVGRIAKSVALRITATHLYFAFSERVGTNKVQMWCELPQDHFFYEYNIDGVSEECNEIILEFTVDYLVTAFRSAHSAKTVKIKLTKKYTPCLTLVVDLPSLVSSSRSVVHDVPVSVVPRKFWAEYQEPVMPQFDVSLYMPSLKTVRNVVDRMKNIGSHLVITAGVNGKLTLKVETDTVVVSTHFENLEIAQHGEDESSTVGYAEAKVDIRKISQFLYGQQINPDRVICNLVHNKLAQFFLLHDDVSMQFYLPSIVL